MDWEALGCLWSSFNSAVLIKQSMECKKQVKSNVYNIQYMTKLAFQKSIDIPITWLLILNSWKNDKVQLLTSNNIPKWITNTSSVRASQVVLQVQNPPANEGDVRDVVLIPGLGRVPIGGHGYPLQYSCLENPRDGGAWWAAVYGVAQSRTRLKRLSSSNSSSNDTLLWENTGNY